MKTFVSEELKGLKQEHRLLSLRECGGRPPRMLMSVCAAVRLTGMFSFRHRCQRVHHEEENQAGFSGAAEDRTL